MEKVLIFYSEIALKGKNKREYENKLKENIKLSSKRAKLNLNNVKKSGAHYICFYDNTKEDIINCLSKVFGIKYFTFAQEIKKDPESILNKCYEIIDKYKENKIEEFNIQVKRADKQFSLDTIKITQYLREYAKKYDININYKNKTNIINLKINLYDAYIYFEKHNGPGGLPSGSSARTLVLLSGGIDSPVAAWMIMKRGATCDFLHFHTYKENKEILNSKIIKIVEKLNEYQYKSSLICIPHNIFDFSIMGKNIFQEYELVLFKHYIFKMADIISKEYGYYAIVNGDSLAQVASQTLENIKITSQNIDTQILRPLIGFEKEDIINLAVKIGTYDLSIEDYKDCCSLISKNQITKAKEDKFEKNLEKIDFENTCKKSFEKLEVFKLK